MASLKISHSGISGVVELNISQPVRQAIVIFNILIANFRTEWCQIMWDFLYDFLECAPDSGSKFEQLIPTALKP